MINQLKYWDGAKLGLKRKPEVSREAEEDQARKKEKSKTNEANRVRPLPEGLLFTCQFFKFAKLQFSDQL